MQDEENVKPHRNWTLQYISSIVYLYIEYYQNYAAFFQFGYYILLIRLWAPNIWKLFDITLIVPKILFKHIL